jgi:hypothetical protein
MKWPLDDSGFDLRAEFLEKFARKLDLPNICNGTGEAGAVSGFPCPGCSHCEE